MSTRVHPPTEVADWTAAVDEFQGQARPLLMDVPAAAAFAGVKERAMRHLFNRRAFPLVALGTRLYVRRSTLLDYLEAQTMPSRVLR